MSEAANIQSMRAADPRSRVDRVYEHLLERIISGEIHYGDTISIKKVAVELSVSSMPVREAVKRLEFEGVVTIKPRSACKVRVPTRKMILEVYQIREAMEGFAVTCCGSAIAEARLERLRDIVGQMRLCGAEPDVNVRAQRAIALDRRFHEEIIGLADNELLNAFSRQLSLHVNMTLMHEKTYHALESDWAEMHATILDWLQEDPARAVVLLREQFARATELWMKSEEQASAT
jgi:DNA-binding GntR family transcriptional regulator